MICENTVPKRLYTPINPTKTIEDIATDIRAGINRWEHAARWDYPGSGNIIEVSDGDLVETCASPADPDRKDDMVGFYNESTMRDICDPLFRGLHSGCWTTLGPRPSLSAPIGPQTIALLETIDWNAVGRMNCTRLHRFAVHESGHSFGVSHISLDKQETEDSVMYQTTEEGVLQAICHPTEYDVVAMMANYQSRTNEEGGN